MSLTVRMLPPNTITQQTVVANGRTYTGAPGDVLDVPDMDAATLGANGWIRVALSGPTTSRPTTNPNSSPPYVAAPSVKFLDTTLGCLVVFDGFAWRNPNTGAAV